jgi:hypothetical protein
MQIFDPVNNLPEERKCELLNSESDVTLKKKKKKKKSNNSPREAYSTTKVNMARGRGGGDLDETEDGQRDAKSAISCCICIWKSGFASNEDFGIKLMATCCLVLLLMAGFASSIDERYEPFPEVFRLHFFRVNFSSFVFPQTPTFFSQTGPVGNMPCGISNSHTTSQIGVCRWESAFPFENGGKQTSDSIGRGPAS